MTRRGSTHGAVAPVGLLANDTRATALVPAWLYIALTTVSGELDAYPRSPPSDEAGLRGEHDGTRMGWDAWLQDQFWQAAATNALLTSVVLRRR